MTQGFTDTTDATGATSYLRGAQVKALVRGIEPGMKHEAEEVYRVDVVPISAEGRQSNAPLTTGSD